MGGLYDDPTTSPTAWVRVIFNDVLYTPGHCKVSGWKRAVEYDEKKGKGTSGAVQTLKQIPPAKGSIEFFTWTPQQRAAWSPILDALRFDPTKLQTSTPSGTTPSSSSSSTSSTSGGTPSVPAAGQQQSSFTGNTPNADTNSATKNGTQPTPLGAAFAIAIYHPALADIDVHYVLPPEKLGAWEPVSEDDYSYLKRTIEFVEYTGTPPNKSVATTPTGAADPATTPSPGAGYSQLPAPDNAAAEQATQQQNAAAGAQAAATA